MSAPLRHIDPLADSEIVEPILQFFRHAHLPPQLAEIVQPFWAMAASIIDHIPRNPERSVALRKLLEAKDCAVRAAIYQETSK
jgi:hypothetical protein